MKLTTVIFCSAILLAAGVAYTQAPPTAAPDQMALLKSSDAKLEANIHSFPTRRSSDLDRKSVV